MIQVIKMGKVGETVFWHLFCKTKYATIVHRIPQALYLLIISSVIVWRQRILFKAEKSSNRIITWYGYIT